MENATQIVRALRAAGHRALFAGGCVRDQLLGRAPKDVDIATDATPEQVEALFDHTHAIGKAFGVIQVLRGGETFEVATFRQDLEYQDGRRPSGIRPSSPEEDARRRDFTINGLFYDPLSGDVIDFVGGQADLRQGVIRAIGDPGERFKEDHLRLLRAVRFACTLGFTIEAETLRALRARASDLARISPERVRVEFVRTLTESPRAGDALECLADTGLLAVILPEALALKGCQQPPRWHPEGDVWTHTVMMLNGLPPSPPAVLALGVLLHDIGKPATYRVENVGGEAIIRFTGHAQVGARMADAWMRRYRFSNAEREAVVTLVDRHMNFMNVAQMKKTTLRRMIGDPLFDLELALHKLDCQCSNGVTESAEILERTRAALADEPVLPKPWIHGRDLTNAGIPPGPRIGELLRLAYEQQLSGEAASPEELLAWALRHEHAG